MYPYLFTFADKKLSTLDFSEQQNLVRNTFSITTKQNGFLVQTLNEKELHDWLYAINPLLTGKIR